MCNKTSFNLGSRWFSNNFCHLLESCSYYMLKGTAAHFYVQRGLLQLSCTWTFTAAKRTENWEFAAAVTCFESICVCALIWCQHANVRKYSLLYLTPRSQTKDCTRGFLLSLPGTTFMYSGCSFFHTVCCVWSECDTFTVTSETVVVTSNSKRKADRTHRKKGERVMKQLLELLQPLDYKYSDYC